MNRNCAVVVTSIARPNKALQRLAEGCVRNDLHFIVIGDVSSPSDFHIPYCDYHDLKCQLNSGFSFARHCPERHYSRKNIGYLLAMESGAKIIVDTDDDNLPQDSFWEERTFSVNTAIVTEPGWLNVYSYFTDDLIWPRGLPLNRIHSRGQPYESLSLRSVLCPIQQGLVNVSPDVDAIFRLVFPGPIRFKEERKVALAKGVWCPINSQNTTWQEESFPLLYLPSSCSFRMTDIIRGFVAQRIAWENDWMVLFHEPTMWQERNEHNLMKDFQDEIVLYLDTEKACDSLWKLTLSKGHENLCTNLKICYDELSRMCLVGLDEMSLLDAWIEDVTRLCSHKIMNKGSHTGC